MGDVPFVFVTCSTSVDSEKLAKFLCALTEEESPKMNMTNLTVSLYVTDRKAYTFYSEYLFILN